MDSICPEYYELFKFLRRVKIDPRQINKDFGKQAAFTLNHKCPIVVRRGGLPLDVLAMDNGFESDEDLYEHIMNYQPKYLNSEENLLKLQEEYYERTYG